MIQRSKGKSNNSYRRGYIMLAVLVALVVAGLGMVTLAQRSMRLSGVAVERQRALQERWGTISCQQTILPAAPALFDQLQEQAIDPSEPAPATLTAAVILGGSRFELLLADENAKSNLNHAYHHRGRAGTERLANQSVRGMFPMPVRLHPAVKPVDPFDALLADQALPVALHSWGQVFELSLASGPAADRWIMPRLTSQITLWGQGKVNVRRASDTTIIDACQLVVSQGAARQLVRDRRDKPKHRVDQLVKQLDLDREEQLLLQDMLTEYSSCFSLWTTVRSTHIEALRFAVLQVDDDGVTRTTEFVY